MSTSITIKERPILFSGAMVRALLAGSKTQTRRAVKPQPEYDADMLGGVYMFAPPKGMGSDTAFAYAKDPAKSSLLLATCPYGQPGDRLWVRETWRIASWREKEYKLCVDYAASPEVDRTPWLHFAPDVFAKYHKQSCEQLTAKGVLPDAKGVYNWPRGQAPTNWRPSIFMPRVASRLLLEITAVRCERLQDISESDAVAEGIESCIAGLENFGARARGMKLYRDYARKENSLTDKRGTGFSEAVASYESLWASINGPESWAANPWVWVVEFKVINGKEVASA